MCIAQAPGEVVGDRSGLYWDKMVGQLILKESNSYMSVSAELFPLPVSEWRKESSELSSDVIRDGSVRANDVVPLSPAANNTRSVNGALVTVSVWLIHSFCALEIALFIF